MKWLMWICFAVVGIPVGMIVLFLLWSAVVILLEKYWRKQNIRLEPDADSPFPELVWSGDAWDGEVRLPFWTGSQTTSTATGDESVEDATEELLAVTILAGRDGPSEAQSRAYQFLVENDEAVGRAMLVGISDFYHNALEDLRADTPLSPAELEAEFPGDLGPDDFRERIVPGSVYVLDREKEGLAYTGFGFDWWVDEEHGLGVVMHGDRYIMAGDAATAFAGDFDDGEESG